jgi:ABC-2 type transport system permease protein
MRNTWIVFKREFAAYFNSPIAYIFMIICLVTAGFFFFFLFNFFLADRADMGMYFISLLGVFVVFLPGLAMRLWAEERKVGTEEVLLTLPMRTHEVVIGKYLAAYALLGITLLLTFLIPIMIASLGDPDWGPIVTGYVGIFLVGGALLGVCSFLSALTENQILAFAMGIVACLVLLLPWWTPVFAHVESFLGSGLANTLAYFGITQHFENQQKGILDLRDLFYYASVMVVFLFLNHFAVENRKY